MGQKNGNRITTETTAQSKWRRPGTSARNKRKSIEDKGNRSSKQNKAGGEGLELVRGQTEVNRKTRDTARKENEIQLFVKVVSNRAGISDFGIEEREWDEKEVESSLPFSL